jgi:hypothetical protein
MKFIHFFFNIIIRREEQKMKIKKFKLRKFSRGSILGLVLVIGICLAILGWGMLHMGFGSQVNSIISTKQITAREAADAGIAKALYEMNLAFPASPVTGVDSPGTLDNSNATYSYRIDPYGGNYLITSTGTSNRGQRVVYGITDMVNDLRFGIIVSEEIVLNQGTLIDGYDSDKGYDPADPCTVRIGTNSISEKPPAITLKNNVIITGDVLVGVGGDPEQVITGLNSSPGPSMNARYAMRNPYEWTKKTIPVGLPPGEPINFVVDPNFPAYPQGVFTITQSGVYNSISVGQGQLLRIESITVPKQPIALVINSDLNLGQASQLRIVGQPFVEETWTPTIVFLGGDLNGSNSNGINNETWKPINFYLYGTGDDQTWIIKNSTDFYGVYNGEFADITIKAKGAVYGSVAGRNFTLNTAEGGPPDPGVYFGVHYDVDLEKTIGTNIGYEIKRWWEEVGP